MTNSSQSETTLDTSNMLVHYPLDQGGVLATSITSITPRPFEGFAHSEVQIYTSEPQLIRLCCADMDAANALAEELMDDWHAGLKAAHAFAAHCRSAVESSK